CFFEELTAGDRMDLSYQVYDGGDLEIDFWLSAPDERMLNSVFAQTTGTYGFNADKSGRYKYCFNNQVGTYVKAITFSMKGPDEKISPLNEEINKLSNAIHTVVDEVNYLNQREMVHRGTAKSTNSRVFWWSIFQTFVLVGVCGFQIYYIKSFFEVRKTRV
ncbi:supernatant protein factor C-terminal domain-containing protein, partial [Chytridium lagenaria]